MRLLVATRNAGKQREFRRLLTLEGLDIVFPDDVNVWETPAEVALELHDSFQANARAKAEYFCKLTGYPTIAEDSGLEVFSLDGAPGVRSKRWAGATGSAAAVDAANNAQLARRLAGATETRRRARYRCVIVLLRTRSAMPDVFDANCTGSITTEPRGTNGFGYDPYFLSDDLAKTFGEATDEEKDGVSHRARAVRMLMETLTARPLA
ncbi:MAG: non-canonical purine NTP pyrophosphatase [Gemmatimonadota bacterium]